MFSPIHLIEIDDREARKQAIGVLMGTEKQWVSLDGNLFGITDYQAKELERHNVPFIYRSKTGPNGAQSPVQS